MCSPFSNIFERPRRTVSGAAPSCALSYNKARRFAIAIRQLSATCNFTTVFIVFFVIFRPRFYSAGAAWRKTQAPRDRFSQDLRAGDLDAAFPAECGAFQMPPVKKRRKIAKNASNYSSNVII